jgi:hypothetical protein
MTKIARISSKISSELDAEPPRVAAGARTGRLVRIDVEGRCYVDFPGNAAGPVAAKLALTDTATAELLSYPRGTEVLLVFEDNDFTRPVIIGRVRDRLPQTGIEIHIRGRRFAVETDEEIELRCGDAKLRISRDGKVVVLGNEVVSRARRENKIRGGTVNIN